MSFCLFIFLSQYCVWTVKMSSVSRVLKVVQNNFFRCLTFRSTFNVPKKSSAKNYLKLFDLKNKQTFCVTSLNSGFCDVIWQKHFPFVPFQSLKADKCSEKNQNREIITKKTITSFLLFSFDHLFHIIWRCIRIQEQILSNQFCLKRLKYS